MGRRKDEKFSIAFFYFYLSGQERITVFPNLMKFHTILKKTRISQLKVFSRMYFSPHCQNKNMGCIDLKTVGA